MALSRAAYTGQRLLVALAIFITLVVYFRTQVKLEVKMVERGTGEHDKDPISGLGLSLEQVSTASPPVILARVTNNNPGPITLLDYNSPLDKGALAIGLITITPAGRSSPLDLPLINVSRLWPPSRDSLITIAPGDSAVNEITLRAPIVSPEELGTKATIQLRGRWNAVWAKKKDDISDESIENPYSSSDAFQGEFEAGHLEITVS